MPRKPLLWFAVLASVAYLVSYKPGGAPIAFAKTPQALQATADAASALTLPTAPATWSLTAVKNGVSGNPGASVTRPAGGTGVKHVATCVSLSFTAYSSNPAPFGYFAYLGDGASGTGTVLFDIFEQVPPGTSYAHSVCDLNIVGSPNTPMTLEFIANSTSTTETVNLVGYDAQ